MPRKLLLWVLLLFIACQPLQTYKHDALTGSIIDSNQSGVPDVKILGVFIYDEYVYTLRRDAIVDSCLSNEQGHFYMEQGFCTKSIFKTNGCTRITSVDETYNYPFGLLLVHDSLDTLSVLVLDTTRYTFNADNQIEQFDYLILGRNATFNSPGEVREIPDIVLDINN